MELRRFTDGSTTGFRVFILIFFFAASLVTAQNVQAFRNLKVGEEAHAFTLQTTDGGVVDYAAPPEVLVVMAFVKQGHEKSEKVVKALNSLGPEFEETVQPLAVILNPEEGDVNAWVAEMGLQFPVLLDADKEVYGLYGVMVAPEVGIIDPQGKLTHKIGGYTSEFPRELDRQMRTILGMEIKEDKSEAVAVDLPPERKQAMREVGKAKVLIKRKMTSKAIPQLQAAIKTDETYLEAFLLLSELLIDEGGEDKLAEAEQHLKHVEKIEPSEQMVKVGLARIAAARGDTEEAAKILEKAAMISPKPSKLYYYLGQTHEKAGNLEGAVTAYKKALEKLLKQH